MRTLIKMSGNIIHIIISTIISDLSIFWLTMTRDIWKILKIKSTKFYKIMRVLYRKSFYSFQIKGQRCILHYIFNEGNRSYVALLSLDNFCRLVVFLFSNWPRLKIPFKFHLNCNICEATRGKCAHIIHQSWAIIMKATTKMKMA